MGHKVKQSLMNSRIDFFYYAFRNVLLVSIPLLAISALALSSLHGSATGSGTDQIQFSLSSSCTMSSVVDEAHTKEINNGTYHSDVGKTTITTLCNDGNGYSAYAVGYSNNEEGNTKLINAEHPEFSIDTGLATSGLISNWAMKLNNIPDDPSPTPAIIEPAYDNTYGLVPQYWTKVTGRASGATDMDEGSSFTTTYAIYTTSNQHAGTYNGQVKYILTHPSYQPYVYYMQEVDKWKNTIALEESVQAIDMRDGKKYWVTKLKDGNIWMTSNLDLDIGGTGVAALTSENTDISTTASGSGIYTNGYTESNGIWTWTPVSTAITANTSITYPNNTNNPTVSPTWPINNYTTPYSAEGGDTYYYTSNTTGNDTRYNSLQACKDANHTEAECKRYFAGNYYNWAAAIASNDSTNIGSTVGEIASNSICPKGWRLPNASQTDNVNNEFGRMLYGEDITAALSNGSESVGYYNGVTSFNKLRSNPYYFVRSGFIDGGTLYSPGVLGFYWSSTVSSSTGAYNLGFNGTNIYPALNSNRYSGLSVRCVAR